MEHADPQGTLTFGQGALGVRLVKGFCLILPNADLETQNFASLHGGWVLRQRLADGLSVNGFVEVNWIGCN